MQRRLPAHGGHVGVGLVLQQVDHDVHAAHERSHVEGSQPGLGGRLDTW